LCAFKSLHIFGCEFRYSLIKFIRSHLCSSIRLVRIHVEGVETAPIWRRIQLHSEFSQLHASTDGWDLQLPHIVHLFLPEVRRLNPREVIQLRNEVNVHEFLLSLLARSPSRPTTNGVRPSDFFFGELYLHVFESTEGKYGHH
jgi:hypothetical protein